MSWISNVRVYLNVMQRDERVIVVNLAAPTQSQSRRFQPKPSQTPSLMSNSTNRHHIRQGESRPIQSGSLKSSSRKDTSFRSFDDNYDDFQVSSKRKRPSEHLESEKHGSRLQLSESHTETKKNTKLESNYRPSTPKTKSLKLSTSSSLMSELPISMVPSSSGNVRALSYLKKKSMGSVASASQEQKQDLFAASIQRKVKPLNPFGVSTTIRTDVLSLPKPRKSRRRKENESLTSIDEIKARMTSVSALDHTLDNAKSMGDLHVMNYTY
jgi:hypothetical protein